MADIDHARAAAHYTGELAKLKAEAVPRVGDRVRVKHIPDETSIVLDIKPCTLGSRGWPDGVRIIVSKRIVRYEPDELEIVERAHYAPPGISMVAMTPERIAALAYVYNVWLDSDTNAAIDGPTGKIIDAIVAEARGEAKS
jgi:hypothetical protein